MRTPAVAGWRPQPNAGPRKDAFDSRDGGRVSCAARQTACVMTWSWRGPACSVPGRRTHSPPTGRLSPQRFLQEAECFRDSVLGMSDEYMRSRARGLG